MAPVTAQITTLDTLEIQMKHVIHNLYELMVQTYNYDSNNGRRSQDILVEKMEQIHKGIEIFHASAQGLNIKIPPEVIQYVDDGRNPDIYTREFAELARWQNQLLKGKQEACASFRDVLAAQMWTAMPELRNEIKQVVHMTGGNADEIEKVAAANVQSSS